jgi:hypothetical protein
MRIRTIKPEFFMHDGLHDLEKETGLPVRVAFIGLWCAADREGRFRWEPRRLKAQILPYDECDFSRVLDALSTRGFLVMYRVNDACFGAIPTWKKHQVINNKERASELPQMPAKQELDALSTRDSRVTHACHKEGKGREGEGNKIAPAVADASERPKDHIFDALCAATGIDAKSLTKSGRGALNAALRDIRAASPDVTPDEINRRAGRYTRKFSGAALTAPALAKHWAGCAAPPADDWTRQQLRNVAKAEPDQPDDILADLPDVKRKFGIA